MLKQIIDFLNLRIAALNYCEELFCLCEIKGESGGDVKQPMQRGSNGEWRKVNFDEFNGVGYWRLRGDVTTEDAPTIVSGKKRLNRYFPLRFVLAVPRDKVTVDDAYSFQRMAVSVEKVVTVQLGDLQLQLGAAKVTVSVNTEKHDPKEVWDAETDNTQTYEPKYELLYGALDMTVVVTADVACFVSECADPDTDILHTFDFCKPTVRERLTDEQVACLEAALCETPPTLCEQLAEVLPADVVADVFDCLTPEAQAELLDSECVIPPCADATITINGAEYGTVPSGGTENIIVESENNNPLGSLVGGNWEVGNAHLRINGTTVGNLEPEQWHDHYAKINGTQAGSWHNSSQTWRMNVLQGGSPVGSLSGTDWVVPPCADATAVLKNTANTTLSTTSIASGASANITAPDATAVLKNTANTTLLTEAIPSNVSENITAPDATITLNGSAYGSAPSGTTFNVVATAPSLSLSTTTSTPAYGASFTITATPTGITPTAYTWYANGIQIGTGPSLTWTVNVAGAITITCVATDATRAVVGSTSITSTVPRNSSLYGDGVNDSALASWKPSATFATSESWSFWFKTNPLGGYRMVLLCGYPTTVNNFCWYLAVNGSALDLRFGEAGGFYGGSIAYTANVWNHMLVSRTNTGSTTAMKAWLNGVAAINTTGAVSIGSNVANNLFFGGNPYGYGRERCSIAAISHYTGAAALADAQQLYNSGVPLAMPTTGTGNLTLQEYFPFMESPVVPSTNYGTPTAVAGINGGRLYCGQGYASPYGLVADKP